MDNQTNHNFMQVNLLSKTEHSEVSNPWIQKTMRGNDSGK